MNVPFEEWTREEKDEFARRKMEQMKLRNEKFKQRHAVLPKEKPVSIGRNVEEYDFVPKPKVKEREWDRGKSSLDFEDWNPHKFNHQQAHWRDYSEKRSFKKEENWRVRSANASKDPQGSSSRLRSSGRSWNNKKFPETSNQVASNRNDNVITYSKQRDRDYSKGKSSLTMYRSFQNSKLGESRPKTFVDADGSASQSPSDSEMDPIKQPAKIENDRIWRNDGMSEVRHRQQRVEKWVKSINAADPEEGVNLVDTNREIEYNKNWHEYDLGFKNTDIPTKENYVLCAAGNYDHPKHSNLQGRVSKSQGNDKKLDSKSQRHVKRKLFSDKSKPRRESDASDRGSSAKESDYPGYKIKNYGKIADSKSSDSSSDYSETNASHGVRKQSNRRSWKRYENYPNRSKFSGNKLKTGLKRSGPLTFESNLPLDESQEMSSHEYDSSVLVEIERHTVKRTYFNNNFTNSPNENERDTNISEDVPSGDYVQNKNFGEQMDDYKIQRGINTSEDLSYGDYVQNKSFGEQVEDYENDRDSNVSEDGLWSNYVQDKVHGIQLEDYKTERDTNISEDGLWADYVQDEVPCVQVEYENESNTSISEDVPWGDYVHNKDSRKQVGDNENEKDSNISEDGTVKHEDLNRDVYFDKLGIKGSENSSESQNIKDTLESATSLSQDDKTSFTQGVKMVPERSAETPIQGVEMSTAQDAETLPRQIETLSAQDVEMSSALGVEISPRHDAEISSAQGVELSPGHSAEASPGCSAETSPIQDVEMLPRYVETSTEHVVETSTEHVVETSTEHVVETDRVVEISPRYDAEVSLRYDAEVCVDTPSSQGVDTPSSQGVDTTSTQGINAPSSQGTEALFTQSAEASSAQSAEALSLQGVEMSPGPCVKTSSEVGDESCPGLGDKLSPGHGKEPSLVQGNEPSPRQEKEHASELGNKPCTEQCSLLHNPFSEVPHQISVITYSVQATSDVVENPVGKNFVQKEISEDLEVINSDLRNDGRSPTSTPELPLNGQTDITNGIESKMAVLNISNVKDSYASEENNDEKTLSDNLSNGPNTTLISVSKETAP